VNIILVVSDTFRRDHLPCHGNSVVNAPSLQGFAEKSLIFEDCYAASFPTVPARADIMTGRYTFTYHDWGPLAPSETTMARVLSEAGYLTCAIGDTPFLVRDGYGYDNGFADCHIIRGQRGPERADQLGRLSELDYCAPGTFSAAVRWLERHYRDKFFLYVDTWDPHEPWDPPEYYVRQYDPGYAGERVGPCYWEWQEAGYSARDLEIAHACYMGEISMVDYWFGQLLERVRTLGLLENTAVIFVADHGFCFGEHGLFGKARFRWDGNVPFMKGFAIRGLMGFQYRAPLHQEVARVPLLMHIPGVAPGRISGLVSLPDLMPTILDLAQADIPQTVQGRSALPLARGEAGSIHDFVVTSPVLANVGAGSKAVDDRRREVLEVSPSTITDGEWDFIYSAEGEPIELYRTREDPGHQANLAGQRPQVVQSLHGKFKSWLEDLGTADDLLETRQRI
jgi:arylsulfatase A-like enzyme